MYFLIISAGYTHCRLETGFCVYKKSCIEPALQTSIDIYSAAKPLFVRSILLPRKHPIPGTCTGQLLSCIRSNFFHWIWEVWQSRLKSNWSTTWEGTWSWSFQVIMQEQCVSNNFHHNPPPLFPRQWQSYDCYWGKWSDLWSTGQHHCCQAQLLSTDCASVCTLSGTGCSPPSLSNAPNWAALKAVLSMTKFLLNILWERL